MLKFFFAFTCILQSIFLFGQEDSLKIGMKRELAVQLFRDLIEHDGNFDGPYIGDSGRWISAQYRRFLFLYLYAKEEDLISFLKDSCPAIRLYACLGLYYNQSQHFVQAKEQLKNDTAHVESWDGNSYSHLPVKHYIKDFDYYHFENDTFAVLERLKKNYAYRSFVFRTVLDPHCWAYEGSMEEKWR